MRELLSHLELVFILKTDLEYWTILCCILFSPDYRVLSA